MRRPTIVNRNKVKAYLIKEQGNSCYWCGKEFGKWIVNDRKGKLIMLAPIIDHHQPYALEQDNSMSNLVLSCCKCNSWKSAKVVINDGSMRRYLIHRWNVSEWTYEDDIED